MVWDGAFHYWVGDTFLLQHPCWDTCSYSRFRGYICFTLTVVYIPKFSRVDSVFQEWGTLDLLRRFSLKSMTVYSVGILNQFAIKLLLIDTVHLHNDFQLKTKFFLTKNILLCLPHGQGSWLQCKSPMNHKKISAYGKATTSTESRKNFAITFRTAKLLLQALASPGWLSRT